LPTLEYYVRFTPLLSANTLPRDEREREREREREKNRNDGLTTVLVDGRRHSHHGGGTSRRGGFDPKKYASKSFVFEY